MSSGVFRANAPPPPPPGDPLLDFLTAPQVSAALITASVALLVGVVAAFLTPAVTSLRARRQAINDKFDAAVAALLLAQAARWAPQSMKVPAGGRTPQEQREFDLRMGEKAIEFYLEKMADAKVALAAIAQHVPEVRPKITSEWELREEQEPELREAIERGRTAALKAERLLQQRRPLSS